MCAPRGTTIKNYILAAIYQVLGTLFFFIVGLCLEFSSPFNPAYKLVPDQVQLIVSLMIQFMACYIGNVVARCAVQGYGARAGRLSAIVAMVGFVCWYRVTVSLIFTGCFIATLLDFFVEKRRSAKQPSRQQEAPPTGK